MDYRLLAGMGDADRRAVLAEAVRRRFRKGEVVFHEGDPGDTFHLLAKGRVAVRITTPSGEVATLGVLGPGEGFGEQAIVWPESRRTATIVALESVETLTLTRQQFDELRARHPDVQDFLVAYLAERVRDLSERLNEALFLPADKRVLRRLVEMAGLYEGGEVPLTQDDLASLAGTTRPTTNRALQAAAQAGLIQLGRGRTVVLDADGLARRAR